MKKLFVSMVVFLFIISVTPIKAYAISSSNFYLFNTPNGSNNITSLITVSNTDRVTIRISKITSGAKLLVSYSNSNKPIILDSIGTYYIVLPPYSNTITVNIRAVFDAPSGYIAGSVS